MGRCVLPMVLCPVRETIGGILRGPNGGLLPPPPPPPQANYIVHITAGHQAVSSVHV